MIKSDLFQSFANIEHGFFGKEELSYPKDSYDQDGNINSQTKDFLNLTLSKLNRNITNLIILDQIHSDRVLVADNASRKQQYDAIVTKTPKLTLAIRTADCVPILLLDTKHNIIAAIHAGWRGAFSGIIENTIHKMVEIGADPKNIIAAIGPCIRQDSYEIDFEFYQKFIQKNIANEKFFVESTKLNHFMFDLPSFVKSKLYEKIDIIDDCMVNTFTDDRFFSYRKFNTVNYQQGYILTLISLND